MKFKIILSFIGILLLAIGLEFGFGYLGVLKTKTVGKAQRNADTEVFYESQSFVAGKNQEALDRYREYQSANSDEERNAIRSIVAHSFADFDENKLTGPTRTFVYNCKYGIK